MIRIHIDQQTYRLYDDINKSWALLQNIMENWTKMIKRNIQTIENPMYILKLEHYDKIQLYYDEIRTLSDDLESRRQPNPPINKNIAT